MSVGIVNFCALVATGVALAAFLFFREKGREAWARAALGAGVIAASIQLVSGVMLIDGWAAQMEHFSFAGFEPTLNPGRTSFGNGMMFGVYLWPYSSAVLGAIAAFAFGRTLLNKMTGAPGE